LFWFLFIVLPYGLSPTGVEGGQEGIREKWGKNTHKNKKICIPVGETDADVKGCWQKGEKRKKNRTGKISGTAGRLGVGEMEWGEIGPQVSECALFGAGVRWPLELGGADVLSVLLIFEFVCICMLLFTICRRGRLLMVARFLGVMRCWRLRGKGRSQRTLPFFPNKKKTCLKLIWLIKKYKITIWIQIRLVVL
jgi:hypothetical protein